MYSQVVTIKKCLQQKRSNEGQKLKRSLLATLPTKVSEPLQIDLRSSREAEMTTRYIENRYSRYLSPLLLYSTRAFNSASLES